MLDVENGTYVFPKRRLAATNLRRATSRRAKSLVSPWQKPEISYRSTVPKNIASCGSRTTMCASQIENRVDYRTASVFIAVGFVGWRNVRRENWKGEVEFSF